jgi:hypothetical protein
MKRLSSALVLAACTTVVVVACDTGYSSAPSGDGGASDANALDATGASSDGSTSRDSASNGGGDGSSTADAAAKDAGKVCDPKGDAGVSPGAFVATHAAAAPVLDGDLSEWCVPFFHLDSTTAVVFKPTTITADMAAMWTPDAFYFAIHVADATHPTPDPLDPFKNDAAELYLGYDPSIDGSYGTTTYHFVVDYQNLARRYADASGGPFVPPTGFSSAVKDTADGYDIEISVAAELLGAATLSAGTFTFDAEISDGDGTQQVGVLYFYTNPAVTLCATCPNCLSLQPYCDALLFGNVTLTP